MKWSPLHNRQTTFPAPAFARFCFTVDSAEGSGSDDFREDQCQDKGTSGCDNEWQTHLVSSAQLESNIFAHSCCGAIRTRLVSLLMPKLRPCFAFSDSVFDQRLLEGALYPLCDLWNTLERRSIEGYRTGRTLTFFPSSLMAYSIVVLIPFSSTKSSTLGCSASSTRQLGQV